MLPGTRRRPMLPGTRRRPMLPGTRRRPTESRHLCKAGLLGEACPAPPPLQPPLPLPTPPQCLFSPPPPHSRLPHAARGLSPPPPNRNLAAPPSNPATRPSLPTATPSLSSMALFEALP